MFKVIILSLLFFVFLNSAVENFNFSWEAASALILIAISGSFLNSPPKRRFLPTVILVLASASCLIFLFALKGDYLEKFFLGLFSFIFLLALAGINIFFGRAKEIKTKFPNLGLNIIKSVILISVFLWIAGSYRLYLDLELSTHLIMLIILINVIISTYCLLKINFISQKQKALSSLWFYPFLLGLVMVELTWAISFWPISQFTAGAIILVNYYVFWNILENYLKNSLNKKVVFSNILFLAVIIILLLSSSQWEIR